MDSYRILTDDQTGIQVGLNGVDANRAASLQVTPVHDLALPASLKGQEVERYQIQVYDGSANRVALTQVAEVIIPTREQIGRQAARVVRICDQVVYNLVAAVKPKYLHFKTQELGDFAVLYPAQQTAAASSSAQSQASATVTKTKGIEKKEDLPKTGESSPAWLPGLAGVLILGGLAVLVLKSKRD